MSRNNPLSLKIEAERFLERSGPVSVIGQGFVGQLASQALKRRGIEVRHVAAPRIEGDDSLELAEIAETFALEIMDLARAVRGSAAVINAAGIAESTAGASRKVLGANALLPALVALACRAAEVPRFIHVSSAAVQGRRSVLDETWETDRFSPYSYSKALGEENAVKVNAPGTVIYRPPGVHAVNRTVTRSLARLAATRLASVAGTGDQNTPQALADNVGDALAHLAVTASHPPTIVNHPSEGLTTRKLLALLGGREPWLVPLRLANSAVAVAYFVGGRNARLRAHARRLEVLWFGQSQAESWLTDDGWKPVAGPDEWRYIGVAVRQSISGIRCPSVLFGVTSGISVPGFFRGLLSALGERGWDVSVTASEDERAQRVIESEKANYIPVRAERQEAPLSDIRALVRLIRILHARKPTVAVWGTPKIGLLGTVASRLTGTPCVYVLHGLRLETLSGPKRMLMLTTERIAMACANDVVAVGFELRQEAIRLRLVRDGRIRVLGQGSANGVSPAWPTTDARTRLNLPHGVPIVGFVGRVTRDKGIVELLRSWPHVHQSTGAELLIAGHREGDSFVDPIASLLSRTPGVRYLGNLEDLTDLYSAIDLLTLPSHREGLPTVVLEAAAFGRPAVVSNATGAGEAVVHGETGLVVPTGSTDALRGALSELCLNGERRRQMGANARAHVMGLYDQDKVHKQWADYLDNLAVPSGDLSCEHASTP